MKLNRQGVVHAILILTALILALPLYLALIAASHDASTMQHLPLPYLPGQSLWENITTVFGKGFGSLGDVGLKQVLWNSLCMAMLIAVGKIIMSLCAAFSWVYFSFPFKKLCFALILITLMLPIEVRLVPTFQIMVMLHGLNHLAGLGFPLMVSATATFLFKQFFEEIPPHLVEAAKLDGAGPLQFFFHILVPMARAPMASLFVILFIYGWNQYLWPLVVTTSSSAMTVVMSMRYLAGVADVAPEWNLILSVALIALLPPCLVLLWMQRAFERGL
ncbi:MAG: ABC transporter permease subunit [Methylococcales bacterium]|nr:ABC transporter permease subunit [Methylococcales bacterium]